MTEPILIPEATNSLPSGLRRRKKTDNSNTTRVDTKEEDNKLTEPSAEVEKSSYVDSLMGGVMRPSAGSKTHTLAITTIDKHLRYLAILSVCTYIILVAIVYAVVPRESIIRLDGVEKNSAIMAMSLIAVSFLSRVIPMCGGISSITGQKMKKGNTNLSGILIGALTVQLISIITDLLLAFFPTPTLLDPVLLTRVHVLRWCGWCPCAGFMTFMVEGADLYWSGERPPTDHLKKRYIHAATQGGAVFLGLLFPFCPGLKSWLLCIVTACCLYLTNYPRMWKRRREIPHTLHESATVEEVERFNSAKIALKLRYLTTAVWSLIVLCIFRLCPNVCS